MSEAAGFFLLVGSVIGLFLLIAVPAMIFVNREIGRGYDDKARRLARVASSEGVWFSADGVRTRVHWTAPLAIAIRWPRVDVRVTSRAMYLIQWHSFFGRRLGQPIVAISIGSTPLDPEIPSVALVAELDATPHVEGHAVVLTGTLGWQRFRWSLFMADPWEVVRAFEAARGARS